MYEILAVIYIMRLPPIRRARIGLPSPSELSFLIGHYLDFNSPPSPRNRKFAHNILRFRDTDGCVSGEKSYAPVINAAFMRPCVSFSPDFHAFIITLESVQKMLNLGSTCGQFVVKFLCGSMFRYPQFLFRNTFYTFLYLGHIQSLVYRCWTPTYIPNRYTSCTFSFRSPSGAIFRIVH